jgi:hypothetical protein
VINLDDIRSRWQLAAPVLDERGRRLFAANEALALGFGGVTATALATGIAWSTINRGIDELQSARNDIDRRVRRPGGGRKSAVAHQPGLPAALEGVIEAAIRGDPCSPLRWVSRSQRQLVKALTDLGFKASQVTAHPGLAAPRNGVDGTGLIAGADGGRVRVEHGLDTITGASSLALQLHSVFQVRALCGGLMSPPPERPGNDMGRLDAPLRKPCGDAADFLRRPADEVWF